MIFVWLLGGCVVVSVAYFLPGQSTELWPNIDSAGIALALYVIVSFAVFARKQDITPKRRITVLAFGVVALGLTSYTWTSVKDQTTWQADRLVQIGTVISRGIFSSALSDSLLEVLEAYYAQPARHRRSLGSVYASVFPDYPQGDSMSTSWRNPSDGDSKSPPCDLFVVEVSDTQVVWLARHPWFKGQDPDFAGYGGMKGPVQVRATLTERGLDYVTEN